MNPIYRYLTRALQSVSLCLLLCASSGCASFDSECELVIMPRVMIVPSSPLDGVAYMARVYAFYNVGGNEREALNWAPASYSDAEAGIITNTLSGEVRSQSLVAEQSSGDNFIHLFITSSPVILVAVDPVNRFYAWRVFEYQVPLERMVFPVRFQLWKNREPYSDSEWTISSDTARAVEDE